MGTYHHSQWGITHHPTPSSPDTKVVATACKPLRWSTCAHIARNQISLERHVKNLQNPKFTPTKNVKQRFFVGALIHPHPPSARWLKTKNSSAPVENGNKSVSQTEFLRRSILENTFPLSNPRPCLVLYQATNRCQGINHWNIFNASCV